MIDDLEDDEVHCLLTCSKDKTLYTLKLASKTEMTEDMVIAALEEYVEAWKVDNGIDNSRPDGTTLN